MATPRNPKYEMRFWTGGVNSLLYPSDIQPNQVSWSTNTLNRGGIYQTRPGYKYATAVPGSNFQGACIFTPEASRPIMLVAVDGKIWASKFPFNKGVPAFTQIEGLTFRDDTDTIVFQPCIKTVKLNADGTLTALESEKPIVIIQDGQTKAGVYDGQVAQHVTAGVPFYGVPIGLWMSWTSGRLWVGSGSRVYASDLLSPDTFSEDTYIAERSGFGLPDTCTGLIETADQRSLLAFTATTTTALQSNIFDRTQWQTTPDFQRVILPSVGCVAGRSPINQYGVTWWYSQAGLINLDTALYSQHTTKLQTVDGEMMRSKRVMASDRSGICTAQIENFLLVSVPAGGKHNEETWVADQSPVGNGNTGMCWASTWTGIRPMQWLKTQFGGTERLWAISYDAVSKDGWQIHVWEAFRQDREDNYGRIPCSLETPFVSGGERIQFKYAQLEICELLGNVDLQAYVGGAKGPWIKVMDTTLQAEKGCLGSRAVPLLTKTTVLESYKPQRRTIKTREFDTAGASCLVETDDSAGIDQELQLLVTWKGRMGISKITFVVSPSEDQDQGECYPGEEGEVNIINDRGDKRVVE